jgi:hypothetical protein
VSINENIDISLQEPIDKVEYVAYALMNSYKNGSKTWYDLAKSVIASIEKYDHLSRKVN